MNQKNLWIALITLIVAIFVFAQVYILFAVTQIGNQIVQLETGIDNRFNQVDKRFTDLETGIDNRFNQVDKRFTDLETGIDKRFIVNSKNKWTLSYPGRCGF